MLAYFGLHGALIAMGKETAAADDAGLLPGRPTSVRPLPSAPAAALAAFFWWLHAMVLLPSLNYLPHSKHMHILTAIPNCFFKSLDKPNTQPREDFVKGAVSGPAAWSSLTWKDLFDGFPAPSAAAARASVPAAATGKPLNPRQVVHDIKMNLLESGHALREGTLRGPAADRRRGRGASPRTPSGPAPPAAPAWPPARSSSSRCRRSSRCEGTWCRWRRSFPEELLNLFENMEQRSNPWGIAPTERTKWYLDHGREAL